MNTSKQFNKKLGGICMNAKLIIQESFTVVGYSYKANLKEIVEQQLVKQALERLEEYKELITARTGDAIFLIQIYELKPNFNAQVDAFTQIIGYKVDNKDVIPNGIIAHTIPTNSYVTLTHKGLESELHQTYDYLYKQWLHENSYHSAGYDFEIWDERYKPNEQDNEIDLYVALK
jgi:AraC family transcriptional regulator